MIKKIKGSNTLVETIVEGIMARKGLEVVKLDMKNTGTSLCDYFIICEGESNTQVDAIADNVEDIVQKTLGYPVVHKEGTLNSQWIILDYFDVIVHIFQKTYRDFYNLEELWADAEISKIIDNKSKKKNSEIIN
jgi:ribosome-associated protein